MMSHPLTRDLVLIGGGHAHALVLRRWAMRPLTGARLTLVDPGPVTAYSGMLPGFTAGHYPLEALQIDLVRLARAAGARLVIGRAEGIDLERREVRVAGRPPVGFDVASLDIGITSAMHALPGFAEYAVPAKPLGAFATRWAALREAGAEELVVIGGGIAGLELAMAMAHALPRARVRVVERGALLSRLPERSARAIREELAGKVEVVEGAPVAEVRAGAVVLEDGRELASDFTVGAAATAPQGWLADTRLALHDGFVTTGSTLQTSDPAVFAAGDCAHYGWAPRPKAGVYAVRAAPVLFHNLRVALEERGRMRRYRPQKDYLKLVSLGGKRAIGARSGLVFRGGWAWRWKDHIDRRFMERLSDVTPMRLDPPRHRAAGAEAFGAAALCGGCGAKVGRGALGEALAALPAPGAGLERLAGDDAAVLHTGGARQVVTTDHLRAFTEDPYLMARLATLHALGDIWAMGARPQAALLSLTLPRMSEALQRRTLAEVMAGAGAALAEAGAEIAGGHTTMGAEMQIGLSLTGLLERAPITLAGARAGDALILTGPLGTGTILAAEMAGRAPGPVVAACLDEMGRGQGRAAEILSGAHAMTDVTGFGLAGHLAGMTEASGVAAELELAAIPLLEGAEALAAAGERSTIWADNRAGAGPVSGASGARGDLLFDPQTCGGMLAAVAAEEADGLVGELQAAGYTAAVIGRVVAGEPRIVCR
ncbi:selenide, water dikinase SelD [Pseudoroseicyclus tamaricis]|uniref:Selenide, water dikinase SelD n=1 Tax=Pseudoroseicyclus tamaricis TaxID=2705421 RepID=A0A6B2JNJ1_9RHOB|nr:selenide, water dikinase SelD [Pseudoroseicyclus tamaricis]NDU99549.1 selenide, water dikinase SelD [Pseudoroseicyclus tamaricis]